MFSCFSGKQLWLLGTLSFNSTSLDQCLYFISFGGLQSEYALVLRMSRFDDIDVYSYIIFSIFPGAADKVDSFFSPAILFIQRWLPLFYVPSLVVVPLAVKGIPAADGIKIGAVLGIVWHLNPYKLEKEMMKLMLCSYFNFFWLHILWPIWVSHRPSI